VFETGKTVHFEARLAVDDGDVGRVVDSGEEVDTNPLYRLIESRAHTPVFRRGQADNSVHPHRRRYGWISPTDSPSVLIYIVS